MPELKGKEVVDLEIDGVDSRDYPDFCDAYFASAFFEDGTELTECELEEFQDMYPELLSEMAYEHFI
jgi:hypothetical protein